MATSFKYDMVLHEYVNIINNEGRLDELIRVCDYYHHEFKDNLAAFEWGMNLGSYIGRFRNDDYVYRFEVIGSPVVLYFIGTYQMVRDKIYRVL